MRIFTVVAVVFSVGLSVHGQTTSVWDGDIDGTWGNETNWVGDTPFADDNSVEFYSLGGSNLTTTLGANRIVNMLLFNANATNPVSIAGNTLFLLGGIQFDPQSTNHTISSTINISNFSQTWNLHEGQVLTVGAVNDVNNSVVTVSNGTVLVTANGNVWQWNMVNGATLSQDAGARINDTGTSVALDATSKWDLNGFTEAFRGLSGSGLVTNYGVGNISIRPQNGEEFVFSGTFHATNVMRTSWSMEGLSTVGTQIFETTLPVGATLQILNGVGGLAGVSGAAPYVATNIVIGRSELDTPRQGTNAVLLLDSRRSGNHVTQDRLPDGMTNRMRQAAELALVGNDTADTTETVGNLWVETVNEIRPHVTVTVDAGSDAGAALTSASLRRDVGGGTILFRGDNLGMGPIGAGTSLVTFTAAPTLSGAGALGTAQAGILPYAIGDNSVTGRGTDFVTHGANGIRLLNASEYTNALGGGANVELTSSPAALSGNADDLAMKLNGTDIVLDLGGNTLTLSAGAIISGGAGTNVISNGRLTFGTNDAAAYDGFLHVGTDLDLSAEIADNGAFAVSLIKTGDGALFVNTNLSYTGRTVINGGNVVVNGNNFLGNGQMSLNGNLTLSTGVVQTIGMLAGSGAATIQIGTNGSLTIQGGAGDRRYYGTIAGPSTGRLIKTGGNIQSLYGTSAFAGGVYVEGGTLELIGPSGRFTQDNQQFFISKGGTLELDNNTGANNEGQGNRLHDNADLLIDTGNFILRAAQNGASLSERIDNITLRSGYSTFTLDADESPNASAEGDITLLADQLIRQNRATALIRGDRLGQSAAGSDISANFIFRASGDANGTNYLSDQSWTNKAPGSTDLPIVPWLTGGTTPSDAGSTFITYQTNFGFRPLTEAEFVNQVFGSSNVVNVGTASNQNFRLSFTAAASSSTLAEDMNALGLVLYNTNNANNDLVIADGMTLNVQNGLILSYGTQDNEIKGGTLTFGNNAATGYEGRIHGVRGIDIRSVIANNGANAVSLTTDGTVNLRTNATYTGQTTVNSGTLSTFGNFLPDVLTRVNNGRLTIAGNVTQTIGMLVSPATAVNGVVSNSAGSVLEVTGVGGNQSYYGQIAGPASSDFIKSSTNTLSLRGASTNFFGDIIVRGAGTLELIGTDGTLLNAASYLAEQGGTLEIDNQPGTFGQNGNNRLSDTASITLNRGVLIARGSDDARSDENTGSIVFNSAYNTITLDADEIATNTLGLAGDIRLTANNLIRLNRATGLVRGDRLGVDLADGAGVTNLGQSQVVLDSVTDGTNLLSHAQTTPGTTDLGVIPWLTGGSTAADGGSTLVTYDPNFGFRPLDINTEFSNQVFSATGNINPDVSNQNFRISFSAGTGARTVTNASDLIVRGLLIHNTNSANNNVYIPDGRTLTVESGIILSTGSQDNEITNGFLTFGPNLETGYEGRIHGVRRIDIGAAIVDNGPNAVSLTTDGTVYLFGSNTYSGDTYINSGRLEGWGTNRLPISTVVTVADAAELRLFGGNQQIAGLQGSGIVGNQNTGANARTLTISNENDYAFSGRMQDGSTAVLNLIKQGDGIQTLSGTNTLSGFTWIQDGTLFLPHALALSNYVTYGEITNSGGALAIRAGRATEWLSPEIDTLLSNAFFASGSYLAIDVDTGQTFFHGTAISNAPGYSTVQSLAKSGAGTLNLLGGLNLPEDLAVLGGTLNITNAGGTAVARDVFVTDAATLRVDGASNSFRDVVFDSTSTGGRITTLANNMRDLSVIRGTVNVTNLAGFVIGQNIYVSNGATLNVRYGDALFRDVASFGSTEFNGGTNIVGNILSGASSLRFYSSLNILSNAVSTGGGDILLGNNATDVSRVFGDVIMREASNDTAVITLSSGLVEVIGNVFADSTSNTNKLLGGNRQHQISMYSDTGIVYGSVWMGPTNGVPGSAILRINDQDTDVTVITGDVVLNQSAARNTGTVLNRGDVVVSSNIIVNAFGIDRRAVPETDYTTNSPANANANLLQIIARRDFVTNDGVGILDRLHDNTMTLGSKGIELNPYSELLIDFNRTNLVQDIAQKVTINNGGPLYKEDQTMLWMRANTNEIVGGNPSLTLTVNLTNVWMNENAHLRINEDGTAVRVGLVLAGTNTYLSESTSGTSSGSNEDFDLLDVVSSVGGQARTLQLGNTNGVAEASFESALLGTASSDVTLNVRYGTLTVTNGVGNFLGAARAEGYAPGTNGLIRLVGTALDGLSNISGQVEVRDFGQVLVNQFRTNGIASIDMPIRVENTGAGAYYFGTQSVIQVANAGGLASGNTIYALNNVVMASNSFLRVDVGASAVAVAGLTLEGNATLSDGVGTTSDDFGLIDVVSSSPGSARTLQVGVSGAGEESFQTILAGVASSDITFDIVNGNMVVTNAGGDVQGSVKVRAGSTFASQNATEELLNLYGNGVVIGNVLVSNTLAPGLSPGTLTVTGNMQFVATSILDFELSATSTNAGANINDLLQIVAGSGGLNGDLTLDGTLLWTNVAGVAGQGWTAGDFWTLITYEGSLTDFGLDLGILPTLDDGFMWMLDTTTQLGEVRLSIVIPEPSTWALLAIGFGAVAVLSRRHRRG